MKGEFYKMEFDAWDEGTVELTLEEEAAYLRLCHQMYRRRGPVPNSDRMLTHLWRCHTNKARSLLRRLIEKAKIIQDEKGGLTNTRVGRELVSREYGEGRRRVAGRLGGSRSGVSRRKSLKDNESDEAKKSVASTKRSREDKIREEKKEGLSLRESPRARGCRLPDDWKPTEEDWQFALSTLGSTASAQREIEKFTDYWRQDSSHRAIKRDWSAAWRNWCRKAAEMRGNAPRQGSLTLRDQQQQRSDDAVEQLRAHNRSRASRGETDSLLPEDPGWRPKGLLGGLGGTVVELSAVGAGAGSERSSWATGEVQVFAGDKRNQGNSG